jgi:V/A-type H+/Na+-transporting ATPase subunit E
MGIDEVKKEIIDNAKTQAKQLVKEAEKEKEGLYASAETRVKAIKEKLDQEAAKAIEQYKSTVNAETQSMSKKRKLAIERDIIDEVFAKVKDELDSLSLKKRENHIRHLMEASGKEFTKVYCSKKDAAFVKKVKPIPQDILGGVILENAEGNVRVDITYENLLEDIRQDSISELSKILF